MSRLGIIVGGGGAVNGAGGGNGDGNFGEEENESRSGSDNVDGVSGDDLEQENNPRKKKKRYHRHTPQQIQDLESVFKECPHPDEKQRLELSKKLCLESRQVKFWFQNRRTQMKTQIERHENALLRHENDKLRVENMTIREAMRNPSCTNCGGPAMLGDVSIEEQHLRIDNARLKDELDRVCALAGKFLGRPISSLTGPCPPMPCSALELGVGTNGFGDLTSVPTNLTPIPDFLQPPNTLSNPGSNMQIKLPPVNNHIDVVHGTVEGSIERTLLLELALAAMEELVKIAQIDEPLWINSGVENGTDMLNYDEYHRMFPRVFPDSPAGFVTEATREIGMAITTSVDLVDALMDEIRWADMFPCIIARASTTEMISSGMGDTRSGSIQLMHAELQVLSPLVPIREVNFLRFCKQHAEGLWAVVDVSIDGVREGSSAQPPGSNCMSCRLLPSGCLVQDMNNGYSKVTWVVHAEYDETVVHELYRPLLRSGQALGARRWLTSLQRQCQYLAILCSNSIPPRDHTAITPVGRQSMLKLAQRMTSNFCSGVCSSAAQKWQRLDKWRAAGGQELDVRMMTRNSVGTPGEPPGIVLSAATSVRLPGMQPQKLFDYLRDERRRGEWDILSNGEAMQEMAHIAKGQHHGNAVSLLRTNATSGNQSTMLILQETCTDASGSLVVYAPIDVPTMHLVMNGGDSTYAALLPSGFVILPDGHHVATNGSPDHALNGGSNVGSLVTVAFQILVNSLPTARLTDDSIDTVSNLLTLTIQKIKNRLQANNIIS